MKPHRHAQKGLSLIETGLVIVVIGLFLMMSIPLLHSYMMEGRIKVTQSRMQAIEIALNIFYKTNGRLPCVASLTAQEGAAAYGAEIGPDCRTALAVAGTFQGKGKLGGVVQIGAVPGHTLNLPDADMTDAWDDNFIYAVTANLASSGVAATVASGAIIPVTAGEIAVVDSNGHPVTTPPGSAQYVIISHGQDSVGAYAGGALGTPCTAGTTESPNCTFPPASAPVTFVKTLRAGTAANANQYDDYVDFSTWLGNNGALPKGIIMILDCKQCTAPPLQCPTTATFTNPAPLWLPPAGASMGGAPLEWLGWNTPVVYCEKQY
jgi:type II secretory pathway pseudopilin PulG